VWYADAYTSSPTGVTRVAAQQRQMPLSEFVPRFSTEEACREQLARWRWPEGFRCPRCGGAKAYVLAQRSLWECAACGRQTSVTAGTIMHRSKVPLTKWFLAAFLMSQSKQGISALELSKQLPLRYETAWLLCRRLRAAMQQRDRRYFLFGTVEMDDAYVGGVQPGKVGRGTTKAKTVVAVAVDEHGLPSFAKVVVVPDFTQATVTEAVKSMVAPGARIITDGLGAFGGLGEAGYDHQPRPNGSWPEGVDPFPYAHTLVSNLKAWIAGTFHGLGPKYLQAYISEFCYRFNRRRMEHRLVDGLLRACVAATPPVVVS
jgi:transposase-like protein